MIFNRMLERRHKLHTLGGLKHKCRFMVVLLCNPTLISCRKKNSLKVFQFNFKWTILANIYVKKIKNCVQFI